MEKVATILISTMKKLTSVLAKNGLLRNNIFQEVNYQDKKVRFVNIMQKGDYYTVLIIVMKM
jgi:hypothetical protein